MLPVRPLNHRQLADNKAWWDVKSKEYPFHAETPTSCQPIVVSEAGFSVASVRLRTGWRTFGFKTAEDRDRFVVQFNAIKVGDA